MSFPDRYQPSLHLISGSRRYVGQRMHALIIELALSGPVRVLIGGNRFNVYSINYALARETGQYREILESNIILSRAEICYQMVELLMDTKTNSVPTLVCDLLTTFYDEGVPENEVDQMLFESILELRRLSRAALVVASAYPDQKRIRLLKALERAAGKVEHQSLESKPLARQHSFIQRG